MKRTDKEIVSAMEYIKSQHNGELPYVFGTFDCAKMMAKYLLKQSSITAVVQAKPEKFKCLARNPNPNSEWNYECDKQCKKCAEQF